MNIFHKVALQGLKKNRTRTLVTIIGVILSAAMITSVASFVNIGYAVLDGLKSPEKPYLFVAGFHKETFDMLPVNLISGRLPENGEEILVLSHVAIKGGVRLTVGDPLTLSVGVRKAGDETLNMILIRRKKP